MMPSQSYYDKLKVIDWEKKQAEKELGIKEFGHCPECKGHFDPTSFWVGFALGLGVMLVMLAVILHLYGH